MDKVWLHQTLGMLGDFTSGVLDAGEFAQRFGARMAKEPDLEPAMVRQLELLQAKAIAFEAGEIKDRRLVAEAAIVSSVLTKMRAASTPATQTRRERIEETTLGMLDAASIAMANCMVGGYALADGTMTRGPRCVLIYEDDSNVVVGQGSEVTVGGRTWTVSRVVIGEGGSLGFVEFEIEEPAQRRKAGGHEIDLLFRDSCDMCGGRAGWDGSTSTHREQLTVGMWCTECGDRYTMTNGRIRRMFFDDPPSFMPGRPE